MKSSNTSLDIEPGTKMLLEIDGVAAKLSGGFVGLVRNKFLITQLPAMVDFEKEQVMQHLYADNKATVRYLHAGSVMGFNSKVIKYISVPFPLLFLGYPGRIESLNLRKHKRVRCLFPARTVIGEKTLDGVITDLSDGGCGLILKPELTAGLKLDFDDPVTLHCPALGHGPDTPLACQIKRFADSGKGMEIGLKFVDKDDSLAQVRTFIGQVANYL